MAPSIVREFGETAPQCKCPIEMVVDTLLCHDKLSDRRVYRVGVFQAVLPDQVGRPVVRSVNEVCQTLGRLQTKFPGPVWNGHIEVVQRVRNLGGGCPRSGHRSDSQRSKGELETFHSSHEMTRRTPKMIAMKLTIQAAAR